MRNGWDVQDEFNHTLHDSHADLLDVLICWTSALRRLSYYCTNYFISDPPAINAKQDVIGQEWLMDGTTCKKNKTYIHNKSFLRDSVCSQSWMPTDGPCPPVSPGAPRSPCMPRGPISPDSPGAPARPRTPSGPLLPVSPGFPVWSQWQGTGGSCSWCHRRGINMSNHTLSSYIYSMLSVYGHKWAQLVLVMWLCGVSVISVMWSRVTLTDPFSPGSPSSPCKEWKDTSEQIFTQIQIWLHYQYYGVRLYKRK